MYQLVVVMRIFRLDFTLVGEDDITYAKSNLMVEIFPWGEILRYFMSYGIKWSTIFCTCQIFVVDT